MEALKNYTNNIIKGETCKIVYSDNYPLKEFLQGALNANDRCEFCYEFRLEEAAKTAKLEKFDMFTTTLLGSPYQKHEIIKEIGKKLGKKHGVNFYYEDFRKGFNDGRVTWRETNLYRQKYCGCIFSEMERYRSNE